jgi:hypothetical protein
VQDHTTANGEEDKMAHARIQIAFADGTAPAQVWEDAIPLSERGQADGERNVANYLMLELRKEISWGDYYQALPDLTEFLGVPKQTFRGLDLQTYFGRRNTLWVWFELSNVLLNAKVLLAQARAYKDLEPATPQNPAETKLLYDVHFLKMEKFDLAVFYLTKVEDLIIRLLFENLGASVVPLDMSRPGWERRLTWEDFKDGLKRRKDNPDIAALTDEEDSVLKSLVAKMRSPHFVRQLVEYRNCIAHRFRPSVDYAELKTPLEDRVGRPLYDAAGKEKGREWAIGTKPVKPDYEFTRLYDSARRTMEHYVDLLRGLKGTPRFGPQALR